MGLRAGRAARPHRPTLTLTLTSQPSRPPFRATWKRTAKQAVHLNSHCFDSLVSRESDVYVCRTSGFLMSDLKAALFMCRDVLWTLRYT